jgi:hypothetical protein
MFFKKILRTEADLNAALLKLNQVEERNTRYGVRTKNSRTKLLKVVYQLILVFDLHTHMLWDEIDSPNSCT